MSWFIEGNSLLLSCFFFWPKIVLFFLTVSIFEKCGEKFLVLWWCAEARNFLLNALWEMRRWQKNSFQLNWIIENVLYLYQNLNPINERYLSKMTAFQMDGIYIRMDKNSETFCRNIKASFLKKSLGLWRNFKDHHQI